MSKVIYVCSRNRDFSESIEKKLLEICNELTPDNIKKYPEHKIRVKGCLAYAVTMSNSALHEIDMNLLLGFIYEEPTMDWTTPGHNYPDGNYALFRNSDNKMEVVSDAAGSRTIWYYHDDEIFIASTSQRAVILFLGSFFFDERVIPWVLSTGSLGPIFSWDRRLQRLQADASVLLDKNTWTLSSNQVPIAFSEVKRTWEAHKELLTDAIRQTISFLKYINFEHWVLPLSGGYDSRAILCFIREQTSVSDNFKTVTWGLETSVNEDGNDAKIARELARSLGVRHEYYHTDISSEPIEDIIDRFIFCSEGRIDHLAAYTDGMEIWKQFHDGNLTGVIRGDEGFGWTQVSSALTVRLSVGCPLCKDYENLKNVIENFGLSSQILPPEFQKREAETISAWRDRLYHTYRIPTILAALSDIKFSYVEQINPLLSRTILTATRSIPDNLRTDKNLFKKIVNTIGPSVPLATKGANANPENILGNKHLVDFLRREIGSNYANRLFGEAFVNFIYEGIKKSNQKSKTRKRKLKEIISSLIPRSIKDLLRNKALPPKIDGNIIAFRVYIILKMHKILETDAAKSRS